MAEIVQLRLEETLDEIEQMVRVGLFTLKEVKCITKKRKHLEYKIQRVIKTKQDFLKYIQYEINVLDLIRKRRKKIGYMHKKNEIDYAVIGRISQLFRVVEYRHQYDVEVWLNHIKFCKKVRMHTPISRIFIRMLQVHSNKPDLWITAAKWEHEENKSIETARKLLLRGLRFNPESKILYQQCFRLELDHVEKIRKRMEIFGLANEDEKVSDKVLEGAVALAVYKEAVTAIQDPEFQTSFVDICGEFEFSKGVEDEIVEELRSRFCGEERLPKEEYVWDFHAKRCLAKAVKEKRDLENAVHTCINIYTRAIERVATVEMYTLYIEMCLSKHEDPSFSTLANEFYSYALCAFQSGHHENRLNEQLYHKWISLTDSEEKEKVIKLALDKHPQSESLWLTQIKYEIAKGSSEKIIQGSFNRATENVPIKNSIRIWHLAIEWALTTNPTKAVDLLRKTLSIPSQYLVAEVKTLYLELVIMICGVEEARKVYKAIRWNPPILESFFWKMYECEQAQSEQDIQNLRRILEDIINHFGKTSIDVWLRYINMESEHEAGNPEIVSKLHWRAMKTLNSALEAKYLTAMTLLNTGMIYE